MKRYLVGLAVFGLLLTACSDSAANRDENQANDQLTVYQNAQPVPVYDYSQVRDTLIQINTMLIDGRQGYATVVSPFTGEPLFACPSIGFPIPADTQVTNPLQRVYQGAVLEQMEPNGTFTSKNTAGTYILCALENGDAVPVYSEPPVIASGAPLVWDSDTQQYQLAGEPSMVVEIDR